MNKKNIFIFLLMALPTLLLTSCLKDQEDTFDEPASIRLSKYLQNTADILTGSENGWVLDYFPDREQSYGGYSYTLKFDGDSGDVEVRTELANPTDAFVSKFKLVGDDGPVLTFDTYNTAMHFFATPSQSNYEGYDGDFEFIILSATAEEIVLKGKRSGNVMYMHPLTVSSEEYQTQLNDFKTDLVFDTAAGVIDGAADTLHIYSNDHWIDIELPDSLIEAPFCYDADGISLYQPVTISGKTVRVFKYDAENGALVAQEDASVVFSGLLIPSIVTSAIGETISTGNSSTTLSYTFNLADKFNYSSDVDWITVSASGKELTINVGANTTGSPRVGHVIVESQGETVAIAITQIEVADLTGNFLMSGLDSDEANFTFNATITKTGDNDYTLAFDYVYNGTYPQSFQMTWDESANRFAIKSGQYMGRVTNSRGVEYYSWLVFMDPTASYWTSNSTAYTAYLNPVVTADGKTMLTVSGSFSSYQVGVLSMCVSTESSISDSSNLLGYYDYFSNIVFTKQ